jgi:flagellar hook-basal body complex protein FliE
MTMSGILPIASGASAQVGPIITESARSFSGPSGMRASEGTAFVAHTPEGASPVDAFGSLLSNALDQANRMDLAASQKVEALASGATDDLHGTMISVKEADISMKLVGSVRNKILDAFQELWRTSV